MNDIPATVVTGPRQGKAGKQDKREYHLIPHVKSVPLDSTYTGMPCAAATVVAGPRQDKTGKQDKDGRSTVKLTI